MNICGFTCLVFWVQWIDLAQEAIALRQVRFSGSPVFDKDGNESMNVTAQETRFLGAPSPELDSAWDNLLKGTRFCYLLFHSSSLANWTDRWFNISETEARKIWGDEVDKFGNEYGYMAAYDESPGARFFANNGEDLKCFTFYTAWWVLFSIRQTTKLQSDH